MKKQKLGLLIFAFLFMGLGIFWLMAIHHRCEVIYPTKAPKIATFPKVFAPVVPQQKKEELVLIRFLSPHAKWYHLLFFWTIALFEFLLGFLFVIVAFAILRSYRRGWIWVFTVLISDILFKCTVGLYMFLCAVPLARVTDNRNILLAYFKPDKSLYSTLSMYLSGMKMYPPYGQTINAVIYAALMLGCFYYFSRKDVQEGFRQ